MLDFLYHLPENLWRAMKMILCLGLVYVVVAYFILPGFARMLG